MVNPYCSIESTSRNVVVNLAKVFLAKRNEFETGSGLRFLGFFFVLLASTCVLYWRYILCPDLLIYAGIGSDNIGQTVPFILNESSRLANGDFSFWNQYQYLGSVTAQTLNPDYLPMLFGVSNISWMMLGSQMLKIVLAGVFFYLFTGYLGVSYKTRFVSGLCCAFCARMIALAPWTFYTLEVVIVSALLWAFERFYRRNSKFLALPFVVAAPLLAGGLYPFALYLIVLFGYAAFRIGYSWNSEWNTGRLARFLTKLFLLVLAGVMIAMPALVPVAGMFSESSRISNDFGGADFGVVDLFVPSAPTLLSEEVVKLFSTSILGTMSSYSGSTNFLNSPYFYFGILPLLGLPFAFLGKTKREKVCLASILIVAFIYFFSTGFRFLLNGFSVPGDDFRQSSCWVIIVFLFIGTLGIDQLWSKTKPSAIFAWTAFLLILLGVSALAIAEEIHWKYFALSAFLLVFYASAFCILRIVSCDKVAKVCIALILTIVPCELLLQNYKQVTQATHITEEDYVVQFGSDPEDSVLAVSNLPEDTYRIDYKTSMLTRSMAMTYLGTQAYIGGSGLSQQMTDFLSMVGNNYVQNLGYTRYVYGFYEDAINSLLGVKYLVYPADKTDLYIPYGYRVVADDGVYRVLENMYALPLIYAYSDEDVITRDELFQVDRADRDLQMLDTAVVPDEKRGLVQHALHDTNDLRALENVVTSSSTSASLSQGVEMFFPDTAGDGDYLELSMNLETESTTSGSVSLDFVLSNSETGAKSRVHYYTAAGGEEIHVPVENKGFTQLNIDIVGTNAVPSVEVSDIVIRSCSSDFFDEYNKAVSERMSATPVVQEYRNGYLKGSLNAESDGYLATSIPWNKLWNVYIDGERVDAFVINLGFVGAPLPAGEHVVELEFDRAPLYFSLISFFATSLILVCISGFLALNGVKRSNLKVE